MWRERAVLALVGGLVAGVDLDASAQTPASRELVARAVAHEHGEGVPKDQQLAAKLYCEAARSGDPEAQFGLGWMYANGRGVGRDDRIAAGLFALAAERGHEHAQRMLGSWARKATSCRSACAWRLDADAFANLPAEKQQVRRARPATRAALRDQATVRARGDRRRIELRAPRALAQGRARTDAAHPRHRHAVQRPQRLRSG